MNSEMHPQGLLFSNYVVATLVEAEAEAICLVDTVDIVDTVEAIELKTAMKVS
jgi:hypothetical protein